jgi:hypothetical protein
VDIILIPPVQTATFSWAKYCDSREVAEMPY